MKAITELRSYDSNVAVPLLKSKMKDREFLVRSFVAMGLGKKQNAESFAALLEMMKFDRDPNVRAEAANSLSFYGTVAASHLALMFERDDHWLVRRSIIAALVELNCLEELFEVCLSGITGDEQTVKEVAIDCLTCFVDTPKEDAALVQLLALTKDDSWRSRLRVAIALGKFNHSQARTALNQLRDDRDHRVVAAALESLV
jgi:HEAT repeat protein